MLNNTCLLKISVVVTHRDAWLFFLKNFGLFLLSRCQENKGIERFEEMYKILIFFCPVNTRNTHGSF